MSDVNALTLEPGEVVGGYTLISRLGSGAMGSVWRVSDGGGQVYAMKILRDSLSDDFADADSGNGGTPGNRQSAPQDPNLKEHVTARERLRREAMALKKVNHPGVCGIVDMELDDALAFIVTELIEGRNLRDDVAANGRYVGDDLERLARKLIEAVKAVHAAGIVHRDIKPTNVMVSATGPILVDFGIAMGEGESHVTRTGLVMGTPGFIAPEIIEGAESDEATDWWSVASVLAFAAMGEPVFGTKPMMAVLEREASGNANLAGLPAHTMTAFRSALNPDPTKRCTPDQLLHAIALDALNPMGWDGANGTDPTNGVMHPFGREDAGRGDTAGMVASTGDVVSTRTLWPGASADTNATAILNDTGSNALAATRALSPEQCTVALPSDRLGPNDVPGLLTPPPPPVAPDAPGSTRVMPAVGSPEPFNPRDGMTDNPAARPALRRIATNANQPSADARPMRFAQSGQFAQVSPSRQTPKPADLPPAYVPPVSAKATQSSRAAMSTPMDDDATSKTQIMPPKPPKDGPDSGRPQRTTVMPVGQTTPPVRPGQSIPSRVSSEPGVSTIPLHPGGRQVPRPEPLFPQPIQQPQPPVNPADPERTAAIEGTVPEFLRTPAQGAPQNMPPVMPLPMDQRPNQYSQFGRSGLPNHANAADRLRGQYVSHGVLPLVVMMVIPMIAAAVWPVAGLIAAALLFWLLFTVGYSETAQLDRESKRGGERKGSDSALRIVQLPWHLVKGLAATIARTLQFALLDVLCMVFATIALDLPWQQVPMPNGYWPYQVPWLTDVAPFSVTNLVAAGVAATAWILTSLWPFSEAIRLAAGAMRGRSVANQPTNQPDQQYQPNQPNV
ncbi:serine/threonine-protein kinase [Bifidobacterium callitrichos]|uniref:serine/threonine-protein kinase n=1 Tax=Bifidobacterium callitrichos TaxID=762209 RepID=UPI001CC2A896|nr:serine/threonine-protein kinase [Bifidobacterium callitrichos]